MADTKISALTANASPATEDLLASVDDPGGTPASRKITIANLLKLQTMQGLGSTTLGSPASSFTHTFTPVDSTGFRIIKVLITDLENSTGTQRMYFRLNGLSTGIYDWQYVIVGGSKTTAENGTESHMGNFEGGDVYFVELTFARNAVDSKWQYNGIGSYAQTGTGVIAGFHNMGEIDIPGELTSFTCLAPTTNLDNGRIEVWGIRL